LVGLLIALRALRYVDPRPVAYARLLAFDTMQRAAPGSYGPSTPFRIVDTDEASLTSLCQWPWPRSLIAKLEAAGAASVAFDMVFPEPDRLSLAAMAERIPARPKFEAVRSALSGLPSNDEVLAETIAGSGVISSAPPLTAELEVGGDNPRQYIRIERQRIRV